MQKNNKCKSCKGTGESICNICGGKEMYAIHGLQDVRLHICWKCNGIGKIKCQYCNGTGKHN